VLDVEDAIATLETDETAEDSGSLASMETLYLDVVRTTLVPT
jgi:hypothetical protein